MISYWIRKRNRISFKITAAFLAFSFLYSALSAPFLQANLWEERRKAVEDLRKEQEPLEIASIAGLPLYNSSLIPSSQSQISQEALQNVLSKFKSRSYSKKVPTGIPTELAQRVEPYGHIERAHIIGTAPYSDLLTNRNRALSLSSPRLL